MPLVPPQKRVVTKGLPPLPSKADGEARRFFASLRDAVLELQARHVDTAGSLVRIASSTPAFALADLSDVYGGASPTDGQVLTFDSSNGWQPETLVTEPLIVRDWIDDDTGYVGSHYGDLSACRIKYVSFSGATKTVTYPDGDDGYSYVWADRATYTYS